MSDEAATRRDEVEVAELRARLAEAEETLRAIRHGEVDALLIGDGEGDRVYTLRGADAPYRALIEQMQEGAVTLNDAADIVYCNRYFAELVDTPLQQVLGTPLWRFVDEDDHLALAALVAAGIGKLSTCLVQAGRPSIDVRVSVSTVVVDEVAHRSLMVTDLRAITKVQRESQSKDEFLAMLAHELRNPLGAIGGAVQVLGMETSLEPRGVRARDVIRRQVMNMARLVDDLLDVGRVVTGKIVLVKHRVDLAETARACVTSMMASQSLERRVELSAASVFVQADPVRLEQVVGNLVSNALKFTPPGQRVRVVVEADGSEAVLRVVDEGVGIPSEVLPRIFDLFVQATVAPDRSKGGLGIGLTMVRRLVELHGGTVAAESAGVDRGSTFTVRLPVAPAAVAVPAEVASATKSAAKRVLLVDDHADAREMNAIVLQVDGHAVFEAGDGDEALAVFRRERPAVAVVDIGLPGMDGHELARRIRSEPGGWDVTLIALTGYGFPDDRARSQAAGFDRHLVKPVAPEDLRKALDEPVRSSRNA